ncbi:MAG: hypothetical protein R3195_13030 [Gemmatimonadota bacterium]|nr:hypothetical protein [Gemmatimonadota bacterium]
MREWLRPDLSPDTDWLTFPTNLVFDEETGHLFIQDRDSRAILEVDESGELVRVYGRAGEGPGEIGHASAIAVRGDRVVAVDNGNLKILVFRRDGTVETEFRIPRFYRDLEILEDGSLVVVPGNEHAVEIIDLEGRVIDGFGERELLGAAGYSADLALARFDDERVVALRGHRPELYVFDPADGSARLVDLYEMPLMRGWRDEVAAQLRRVQRAGGGRSWMSAEVHVRDGSTVMISPAPPDLMTNGREVWLLDVDTGSVERFSYGEPLIGYSTWLAYPRLFTTHVRDGTILEYRFPEQR